MPNRKYKTDPKILLQKGQLIVSSTNDAKYQHRVECVNLVLAGFPPSQLSKYCGESKNTITSWVKMVDEKDFESLRIKKQTGRPSKLTMEQLKEIKQDIDRDNPSFFGYDVWDGPTLSRHIKEKYHISLCVRQCERLLHNLGFSLIRPQMYPSTGENNEEQRECFKKNSKA